MLNTYWMCVAYAGNVLRAGTVFHRENRLVDKLSRSRSDHMHTQDFVRVAVGEYLCEAVRLEIRLRSGVRHERKLTDLVVNTLLLEIFLRLANPTHFRMRVYHTRHAIVVDVNCAWSQDSPHLIRSNKKKEQVCICTLIALK